MKLQGLPIVNQLSQIRKDLHEISNSKNKSLVQKTGSWLGHKALTFITVPLDAVEVVSCLGLAIISSCTLGTLKVLTFAVTLGNFKPTFSIGVIYLGERALHGIVDIALNLIELAKDTHQIFKKVFQFVEWSASQLHLTGAFKRLCKKVVEFAKNVIARFDEGYKLAFKKEKEACDFFKAPGAFKSLNEWSKSKRIDVESDQRSFADIFNHYLLSVPNISFNFIASTVLGSLTLVTAGLFYGKVGLFAVFKVNVPLPTFFPQSLVATFETGGNVLKDVATDVGDLFILTFKVSEALGINRAVTTIFGVVSYIPEAIFA